MVGMVFTDLLYRMFENGKEGGRVEEQSDALRLFQNDPRREIGGGYADRWRSVHLDGLGD